MRAKTDYVKLEYQILDLVEYNGLKITGNMKILLSLIYSYEKKSRTYYESITTLGKRVGLEPQAARSLVSKLCDAGMISYEERKGSSHIFHSKPLNQELMTLIGDEKPKKSSKATNKKSEEKQENGNGHEQAETPQAEQAAATATPSADEPADHNPGMAAEPAQSVAKLRSGVESDPEHGSGAGTDDTDAVKPQEPEIFDDYGVVTEAFINSLTGDGAPRRNDDGTLKSYAYTYRLARAYDAHRCGKPDAEIMDCLDTWMKQAQPWHIPQHLLPKQTADSRAVTP